MNDPVAIVLVRPFVLVRLCDNHAARSLVTPDRPSRPPNKEIFEYIQAYLSIFDVFLKNI
jgi:hypothetical protein